MNPISKLIHFFIDDVSWGIIVRVEQYSDHIILYLDNTQYHFPIKKWDYAKQFVGKYVEMQHNVYGNLTSLKAIELKEPETPIVSISISKEQEAM